MGLVSSTARALLLAAVLELAAAAPAVSQTGPSAAEYQIKAAYLVKFLGYVDWPAQAFGAADAPLVIGVLGAATLADELAQVVAGRQAGQRAVVVRKLRPGEGPAALHVLFVAQKETARLPAIAAATGDPGLLVVTEANDAMPPHSAINFVVVDDKVRFDVDMRAVDKAQLRISARLLTVARKVQAVPQ